jgi:hypothetical protein
MTSGNPPSTILKQSTAHYAYNSEKYILVTNIDQSHFLYLYDICDDVKIFTPEQILSQRSLDLTAKLRQAWNKKNYPVNHAATEEHCILRWLALADLYDKNIISADNSVFSHDWDDLIFVNISKIACTSLSTVDFSSNTHLPGKFSKQKLANAIVIASSYTAKQGIRDYLQPSFLMVNKFSIVSFCDNLINLLNKINLRNRLLARSLYFNDMHVWAYTWNKLMLDPKNICNLWNDMHSGKNYYFCCNMRSDPGIETRYVEIPNELNYFSKHCNSLEVINAYTKNDGQLYVRNKEGEELICINLHYQGIEGKYIMMKDRYGILSGYYNKHPLLLSVI